MDNYVRDPSCAFTVMKTLAASTINGWSILCLAFSVLLAHWGCVARAQSQQIEPAGAAGSANKPDSNLSVDEFLPESKAALHFEVDTKFASDSSSVVGLYLPSIGEQTPKSITAAAKRFVSSLNEEQLKKIQYELSSQERSLWSNLPVRPNAGGLRFDAMEHLQIEKFLKLLAHVLSPSGYEKMRLIMLGDDQLLRNGRGRPGFGISNFSVAIFGQPSETELWAIQLDGHHLGLNIAIAGENITMAPSFIGAQPANYTLGPHAIEPMKTEGAAGFKLAQMLDKEQFKEALVRDTRGDLKLGPGKDGKKLKTQGIACSKFTEPQQQQLMRLVAAWVGNLPKAQARKRFNEIQAEMDQMYFSWSGSREPGGDASYTIQGPSLVIEFAYQDLGGVPDQHLHSQYRNPKNEYGAGFKK